MKLTNLRLAFLLLFLLVCTTIPGIFMNSSGTAATNQSGLSIEISEICAKNDSILADNQGKYRDYIELYNAGETVNLENFVLTDGKRTHTLENCVLKSGEYKVLFLGTDTTGFSLSAGGGETIQLQDPTGCILVQTNTLPMAADQVMIRKGSIYTVTMEATPGFPNNHAGLKAFQDGQPAKNPSIHISEMLLQNRSVLPDENGLFSDIIELHNISDATVNLSSWWLSDLYSQRFRYQMPNILLEPDSYVVIYCDGHNYLGENNEIHTNFSLSPGETIYLTDPNGEYTAIEVQFFGDDISAIPVDSKQWAGTVPSLGFPNNESGISDFSRSRIYQETPVAITEVLLSSSAYPYEGKLCDVVEVTNLSDSKVNMEGWYLSDGGNPYEYAFSQVSLNPGETISVICSDSTTGFSLSSGEILRLTAPNHLITEVTVQEMKDSGLSLSYSNEQYTFMEPSIGYPNTPIGKIAFSGEATRDALRINELMTANTEYLLSSYGISSDWVELYNGSNVAVNLSDYFLTDDMNSPYKYQLPDRTLEPKSYYLIMLSNSPEKLTVGYDVISLPLSSDGDTLYLCKDGFAQDATIIPSLQINTSWGRDPESNMFSQLSNATPGTANTAAADRSDIPSPLVAQGVYDDVSFLDVSLRAEGDIYFTTDCTTPSLSSALYDGPIRLTQTTVIRAICIQPNKTPSEVLDLTYILNEHDELPVVSLVVEPDDLWSRERGIYANGPGYTLEFPHKGANFWKDWEREASVSLFELDGSGFSLRCGTKIFGNWSRGMKNKSFSCLFRDTYGSSSLDYPVFGDDGLSSYESIVLRSGSQDAIRAKVRDVVITSLVGDVTDVIVQKYRPVVLYLNGQHWGVYFIREKMTDQYAAGYFNVSADNVAMAEGSGENCPEYMELFNFAKNNSLADPVNYTKICEMMDVQEYMDYIIAQIYIANNDNANVKFFKAGNEPWKWALFSTELAFMDPYDNTIVKHLNPGGSCGLPTVLINALLKNPTFKDAFIRRIAWQMEHIWNEENVISRIDEIQAMIDSGMAKEATTRKVVTYKTWNDCVEDMRQFARLRTDLMTRHVMDYFDLTKEQMRHYGFDI